MEMKSYREKERISLETYREQDEDGQNYGILLRKGILSTQFSESKYGFEENMDESEERYEGGEESANGQESGEETESREAVEESQDDFEDDHVTCYLKEVSNYPLLTPEKEIELAQAIRRGQDELVELVAERAGNDPILADLNDKVEKLLLHEKNFPGVRDKATKVILRTLEQEIDEHPQNTEIADTRRHARRIAQSIDFAKQDMVKANLRLVLSIAKRYRGRGMSFDDLIQEGNVGLLKAVGRYDYRKGNRFSTYATWWVRQSIIRGIYDKTRTIRLPVHFIELKNLFFKVFYQLLKELGREPSAHEIAERADLPLEKVQMVLTLASQPVSLETPVGEDEQRLGEFIEDDQAVSPIEECSGKELVETTREMLASLQPREEKILRLRFGMDGQSEQTLERIGKSFNVSKERIRQIEKKALQKLRHPNRQLSLRSFVE
jgi:RNA polymerase primary sigma factor